MGFDEIIQQKLIKKPSGDKQWPPDVRDAWDRCQCRMHELDEGMAHTQRRQETVKSIKGERKQLVRQ